jgi:Divergent InlB B-repeat domain
MRALAISIIAVLAIACGGSGSSGASTGSGSKTTLTINTTGDGVVHGAGSDCRGSCAVQVAAGQQMHLQAIPDSGAYFIGWSGSCGGIGTCDVTLDADRTATAAFSKQPPPPAGMHRLNVVVQGTGRVVSAPPGIDCGAGSSCTTTLPDGTGVTLTATPGAGVTFGGWAGACTGTSACSFSLSADASVSARFTQPPPPPLNATLTVAVTGRGVVTA